MIWLARGKMPWYSDWWKMAIYRNAVIRVVCNMYPNISAPYAKLRGNCQRTMSLSTLLTCCKVSQIKNSDYIESTAKLDVRFTPQISWNIKISVALQNISRVILRTNNFSWQVPRRLFYHDTKNKSFFLSVTCIPELRLNKGFTVPQLHFLVFWRLAFEIHPTVFFLHEQSINQIWLVWSWKQHERD